MTQEAERADVMAGECDPGVLASWAAEAVRAVNRLTLVAPAEGAPGWEGVGDIYRLIADLCILIERMPQALGQLARHLEYPGAGVRYRSDASTSDSPEVLLAAAAVELEFARRGADEVAKRLAAAQNSVSHLGTW